MNRTQKNGRFSPVSNVYDSTHESDPPGIAQPFAFGKRTPNARFSLLMMAPFGIAFPDSYSLMTEPFSATAVANCAWLNFFATRACCKAILKSCDTVACRNVSEFSSSFAALGHSECADLLPPAEIFLSVWTSAPLRRAAFTADAVLAALPF